jgi:Carboxypeptidase regulatory-like domain
LVIRYLSLLYCLLGACPLLAQTATLRGQVSDDSGAVIPAARITVTGPTGLIKTTTAAIDGRYSFAGLAPGNYTVQASAPDLALPQPAKISLTSGVETLNLRLTVVSTTQRVTVRDNAGPALTADAAGNASALVMRGADLEALADNPDDLQADLMALAGPSAGPGGGAIFRLELQARLTF